MVPVLCIFELIKSRLSQKSEFSTCVRSPYQNGSSALDYTDVVIHFVVDISVDGVESNE